MAWNMCNYSRNQLSAIIRIIGQKGCIIEQILHFTNYRPIIAIYFALSKIAIIALKITIFRLIAKFDAKFAIIRVYGDKLQLSADNL